MWIGPVIIGEIINICTTSLCSEDRVRSRRYTHTEHVEPSELPPPQNVRIESKNLHNELHWSAVNETFPVEYAVQFYFHENFGWRDVPSCSPTSAVYCDFSSVGSPSVNLTLRVRARSGNQTSAWSKSEPFLPHEQTRLGPPEVTLFPGVHSNSLRVQMSIAHPKLKEEYGVSLKYRVVYWEQTSVTHEVYLKTSNSSITLKSLKLGRNYCVQVQYTVPYATRLRVGDLSTPVCTSVPDDKISRRTEAIVAAVCVVLFGALICVCLLAILKNYDFLKRALQPAIGPPDHLHAFLKEEFNQLPNSNVTTPDPEESVTYVHEDEEKDLLGCLYPVPPSHAAPGNSLSDPRPRQL
ncbi:interferon alpha/beta receptor 1-like isoform X3 [Conger conger]|uniref:interferon alpha/beta receptor 1-like isoform X3 n=1 Tax=Conger conger TaxID=82655 RepID=UPI002A5A86ED|nr:interferon alpha/beta receptor 1-like isoform X3 [Conger conger]